MTVIPAKNFYKVLQEEGLRLVHQYQVTFVANELPQTVQDELARVTFLAQGLELPSRTQNFAPVYYLGYEFQQATNMSWTNEITMTINCDAYMKLRDALLLWQGITTNPAILLEAKGDGIKTASMANMQIDLYDQTMTSIVESYVLYGVVPANVGDMSLSNTGDAVASFPASFKYQFWSTIPAAQ